MSIGRCIGRNSDRPKFISISVPPITNTETMTPIISAHCWRYGVAPIRNPVFRSCEVAPAFAAATQTTPPMMIASAE